MTGAELRAWRFERKITQEQLGKAFGVDRNTVSRWEQGKHRLPMNTASILERLAYTTMPKPVDLPPEWISIQDHPHLYEAHTHHLQPIRRNMDHPHSLVKGGWLAWEGVTFENVSIAGPHWPSQWPASVLETEAYKNALARRRAGLPGWSIKK